MATRAPSRSSNRPGQARTADDLLRPGLPTARRRLRHPAEARRDRRHRHPRPGGRLARHRPTRHARRPLNGAPSFFLCRRCCREAYRWFPSFKRFLNMERECLACGFNMEQTDKLLYGQRINYSGWLHSNEYRRNALADNVTAQVIRDEKRNLFLHINQTPIAQWFKEQFGLGQEKRRGIRR